MFCFLRRSGAGRSSRPDVRETVAAYGAAVDVPSDAHVHQYGKQCRVSHVIFVVLTSSDAGRSHVAHAVNVTLPMKP